MALCSDTLRYDPTGSTSNRSFINVKKSNLKMTIQLLKLYLKLAIYRCKNVGNTTKNGDFNRKNNEDIL